MAFLLYLKVKNNKVFYKFLLFFPRMIKNKIVILCIYVEVQPEH